ncbi:hypothetical protein ACFL0F_00355 [Patescibacteria group bacterium]
MNKLIIIILVLLFTISSSGVVAQTKKKLETSNGYYTLVNPVRPRFLWSKKDVGPLINQYGVIKARNLKATWLLQYEILKDSEVISELHKFNGDQEFGVFLEVTSMFSESARVIYPHGVDWANPKALFLSGYSRSERRKLIDELFGQYKEVFEHYPKSVGAWWIDSYSLTYMKQKYDINIALIVADQRTTDRYGVWGQWWGIPYIASNKNILLPALSDDVSSGVAVIQWAQRHPQYAYGEGPEYSNYSLQANDYLDRELDITFFGQLSSIYLNNSLPLGQVTVGLETGMESVGFHDEYVRQIDYLASLEGVKSLTMSEFSNILADSYESYPQELGLKGEDAEWLLARNYRKNLYLGDDINYHSNWVFSDYFVADKEEFLDRRLPLNNPKEDTNWGNIVIITAVMLSLVLSLKNRKLFYIWLAYTFWFLTSYWFIVKSEILFGWKVYYGPVFEDINGMKLLMGLGFIVGYLVIYNLVKKIDLNKYWLIILLLPLVYGFNSVIRLVRVTFIEGVYYVGIAVDAFRLLALTYEPKFNVGFIYKDFPSVQAAALLRFDYTLIWNNPPLAYLVVPIMYSLMALLLWFLIRRFNKRTLYVIVFILILLFVTNFLYIMTSDPRVVIANN